MGASGRIRVAPFEHANARLATFSTTASVDTQQTVGAADIDLAWRTAGDGAPRGRARCV